MTQSNGMTFAQLEAKIKQLGSEEGTGRDTQVKALMQLVEASYHGAIDMDADKHGTGVDDATRLAELYVKSRGGATIFDAKAPNQRKLISCFRTNIKLGQWSKGGPGEPLTTMGNLHALRLAARKDPVQAKKLDDAANVQMRYARAQIKQDSLIENDALRGMIFKPVAQHATALEIVEQTRKTLIALRDGRAASNTAQDNSGLVVEAIQCLSERIREVVAKSKGATIDEDTGEQAETAESAAPSATV